MQDRCPRDQLLVNGGVVQLGLLEGRVLILGWWLKDVSTDIGEGYASNPPHAGQDRPGLVEGLCGRGQVKGHRGILGLLVTRAPFILKKLLGMVQAWVGHFVTSIILPKVILSYLSTYDER